MNTIFKRMIALVCLVCLCAGLVACGTEPTAESETAKTEIAEPATETAAAEEETAPEAESEAEAEPEVEEVAVELDARLFDASAMTEDELDALIVAQDNHHGFNSFVVDDLWLYGIRGGDYGEGQVFKMRHDWSDWTVLDWNTNYYLAKCMAIKEGYLYYCQYPSAEAEYMELVKMRASGNDATVIVSEMSGDVLFVDDYIYYTSPEYWNDDYTAVLDESAHLYRCDLNGENVELLLDKPVYYYTVFGDSILYQDDHDGCTLHLYNMVDGTDERLNDQISYWPIYDGEYIYYLADEDAMMDPNYYTLWRMTPDGSVDEPVGLDCHLTMLSLRGDYIYFVNTDDGWRIYRCQKDGTGLELITQDANIMYFQWIENSLVYMRTDSDGYVDGVFVCSSDGSGKSEF